MPFPRILRLQDNKWNNPEDSIGTFIGYLRGGRYRCWEAAGPARQAFGELSPDIKDLLETSSIPPTDIVSWSIYMVGHNERNAAPKLLICSTDAKTRKNIRQLIKDSKIMDKYPGIGLGDVSTLPDRPVIRELSREDIEALLPLGCDIDGAVLAEGSEPALGKRIFVVNPHDFSLRPATTGPIIFHGDKCYQLTVAHAFRQTRELDPSSGEQVAEDDCDFDGMSDNEGDDESQYDEITSKGSATPGEVDSDKASFEASLDAFSGEKHSSSSSEGLSSDHLDSGNDPRSSLESSEDKFGLSELDISQLQFFGRLVLSSLNGNNPSLDYALIETSRIPENVEQSSMIPGSLVSNIGEIESEDISIAATTSPNCTVEGRLTATPSYIRLPQHRVFQQVYPIRLGKPLHDGDCGTAVFGKDDKRFYGHIVAGGPGTSIAYLVPAEEISRDIQARIGTGLIWIPRQEGQQHSKDDDLQLSAGLKPDSTNSGVSWIGDPSIRDLEELRRDQLPESNIGAQQWLQRHPKSQQSQNTFIDYQSLTKHSRSSISGALSQSSSVQTSHSPTLTALHKKVHSATGLSSLEARFNPTQEIPYLSHYVRPSLSQDDPGSSSAQRGEAAGGLSRRTVLPQNFEDPCQTCIFWLLSPRQFPQAEWQECHSRKEGISHIMTHAVVYHGLIRGRDPQYPARRYLASCQSSNPFVKAKGDCVKCSSLSEWKNTDFADFAHQGVALCIRCWRKFNKKEMKNHLAGPLCDFNPVQPKAKKLWILYTAFCSETQLPSKSPKNMASQTSPHQPYPRDLRQRRQQDGTAAQVQNLEATRSPSGTNPLLSSWKPGFSLFPSTAGESMKLLRSPKLDASMHLWDEANDLDVDISRSSISSTNGSTPEIGFQRQDITTSDSYY